MVIVHFAASWRTNPGCPRLRFLSNQKSERFRRLCQQTQSPIKMIIQNMIRQHLGWLVIWGGVFGGIIGAIVNFGG